MKWRIEGIDGVREMYFEYSSNILIGTIIEFDYEFYVVRNLIKNKMILTLEKIKIVRGFE